MLIIQIAPECAPATKVGVLGDVVQGLSKDLALRGHAVEIILPIHRPPYQSPLAATPPP